MTMSLPNKSLLRPDEVAEYLRVSLDTVYRMIACGELPAVRIRRLWRIPTEALSHLDVKKQSQ